MNPVLPLTNHEPYLCTSAVYILPYKYCKLQQQFCPSLPVNQVLAANRLLIYHPALV